MKKLLYVILLMFFVFSCESKDQAVSKSAQSKVESKKVQVYYFHGERRCVTCLAVGEVTQAFIEKNYAGNSLVSFIEINLDEPENSDIAQKFQAAGSGLYVYNGSEIQNITAYAFQTARSAPDKLEARLKELIDREL